MRNPLLVLATLIVLGAASPALADARSEAKSQVEFGIAVAQKRLWKEATYRWLRATEIDPQAADAWNNLAVTQLALGRVGEASASARRAVALGGPRAARYRETLESIERRRGS
jgi:Flp pilus assembly protein TadD